MGIDKHALLAWWTTAIAILLLGSVGVAGKENTASETIEVEVQWSVRPEDRLDIYGSPAPLVVSFADNWKIFLYPCVVPASSEVVTPASHEVSASVHLTVEPTDPLFILAFFDRNHDYKCSNGEAFGIVAAEDEFEDLEVWVHSCDDYCHCWGLHRQPFIRPSQASAELFFDLPRPASAEVIWWDRETGHAVSSITSQPVSPSLAGHRASLTELLPDTRYIYEVSWDEEGDGEPEDLREWISGEFTTPPDEWDPRFTFGVIGDTMAGYSVANQLAEEMALRQPDFLIQIGDNIWEDTTDADWQLQWWGACEALAPMLRSASFFPVRGNHDGPVDNFADVNHLSGNVAHYSVQWGSLTLIILDNAEFTVDEAQLNWLEEVLTGANERGDWIVVGIHDPLLAGAGLRGGYLAVSQKLIDHGADLLFAGHFHGYELNTAHPFVQVISGGGGSQLQNPRWEAPNLEPIFHCCTIDVSEYTLCVSAWELGGALHDRHIIYRAGAPTSVRTWQLFY